MEPLLRVQVQAATQISTFTLQTQTQTPMPRPSGDIKPRRLLINRNLFRSSGLRQLRQHPLHQLLFLSPQVGLRLDGKLQQPRLAGLHLLHNMLLRVLVVGAVGPSLYPLSLTLVHHSSNNNSKQVLGIC